MQRESHKNWLLMIAEIYSPAVLWSALAVTFIAVFVMLIIRPIYEAQTVLTLDSDLTKVLRGINTAYPSEQQGDYIRYEYFATHNVALMRLPHLAEKLITRHNIRDYRGRRMFAEFFIHPDLGRLVFRNKGQGVDADWITDTQQFSIKGYAKDPKQAVLFSDDYARLFLEDNGEQFRDVLSNLVERLDLYTTQLNDRIRALDQDMIGIKKEHRTANPSTDLESLSRKIESIQLSMESLQLREQEYQTRKAQIDRESETYSTLMKCESSVSLNPQVTVLKTEIQELIGSLTAAAAEFTPEHPTYIAIEERLKKAQELLNAEAEKTFERDTARVSGVRDTALLALFQAAMDHAVFHIESDYYTKLTAAHHARMDELNTVLARIDNLERQRTSVYDALTTSRRNREDIGSIANKAVPFFRVVSRAHIDESCLKHYKYFPKRTKLVILTFAGVLFLVTFAILGREIHRNSLYRGWQLSEVGLRVDCADVPEWGVRASRDIPVLLEGLIRPVALAFSDSGLVRVTSMDSSEGKATCAQVLARHLVRAGKTVVLIDGDVERRAVSVDSTASDAPGLVEYLCSTRRLDEIVIRRPGSLADIIPTGTGSLMDVSRPREGLATLLAELRKSYDTIVFVDAPASSACRILPDGLPAHDVLLVARSGHHSIYDVERIARECVLSHAVLRGVVLNRTPFAVDMFTLDGWVDLAHYVVLEPIHLIQRLIKARQAPKTA